MGLLDQFGSMSDDQQQGLLAAASQMLQQSGPSLRPMGLGQILGGGMGAYQDSTNAARKRKMEEEQARQMAQLHGLQIQEAQGGLADHDRKRAEDERYRKYLMGGGAQTSIQPSAPAAQPSPMQQDAPGASAMPGDAMSPRLGGPDWMQAYQAQQPMASPQAHAAPVATSQQPASPAFGSYEYMMAKAQDLMRNGFPAQAQAMMKEAVSARPKFSTDFRKALGSDGKMHNYQLSDDGAPPRDSGVGVAPEMVSTSLGGTTRWDDKNSLLPGQTFKHTQSPDSIARLSFDRSQAENSNEVPITKDAITNAAARYNLDGTLPPMGMGKAAAAGRSAILNTAAELAGGADPTQQRRDQLSLKGDVASQNAALKAFTSGKQGNSVRSFNVALSHLDTLDKLADALHNGDMQAINKIGNFVSEQTGSPAPTNFEAAKKIVGDEIVKSIVGAGGGVKDREEAANTIAKANSPAQLKGVIGTYKELMNGQLGGLEQQYKTATGRDDFGKYLSEQAKVSRHGAAPAGENKSVTLADIAATAKASGRSTAEVTAALKAKGYTIGGM